MPLHATPEVRTVTAFVAWLNSGSYQCECCGAKLSGEVWQAHWDFIASWTVEAHLGHFCSEECWGATQVKAAIGGMPWR